MNQQASDNKPSVLVFSTAYHPFIGGAEVAIDVKNSVTGKLVAYSNYGEIILQNSMSLKEEMS